MKLKVLASSSKGNCYILHTAGEALIIEAGVNMTEIKKALNYNIFMVSGCLISHRHQDHSKYAHELAKAGIDVFGPGDIFWYNHNRNHPIRAGAGIKVGNFKVLPFDLEHDVPCLGYHIEHEEMGRLVFITDTYMCRHKFKNVNHWLLEANFSDDILDDNVTNGYAHPAMKSRILSSHMELSTTIGILQANDITDTRNIVLLHLSDGNSNEKQFTQEIMEQTGKPVYVADKGLEINLSKI